MQTLINIIAFILIIGIIIFIHELGHFLAAKSFGVYCSEFSLGMGPKLFSKKVGETDYQLRALPIGGYVAMAGEADQEDNEDMKDVPLERTLKGIHTWQRCVVMLAGVFMNFVLAIVILIGVYSFMSVQTNSTIVGGVVEDSSASTSGMQTGDKINKISIANSEYVVASFSDIQSLLSNERLQLKDVDSLDVKVEFMRNNETITKELKAKYNEDTKSYQMGIKPETRTLSFFEAVRYGSSQFKEMSLMIFTTLGKLVTDSANTIGQLSGPAGIYNVTAQVTESGSISTLLLLVSMLSVNIGIFNLLPIPGLDGSQVLFAVVEKVARREIPVKIKYALQLAGLALVFGLMIYVTINDITKIFG